MSISHNAADTFTATRRYVSEREVESITGLSRRTLQQRRLLGKPPRFYKFGKRVLYDLADIESLIQANAGVILDDSRFDAVKSTAQPKERRAVVRACKHDAVA